MIGHRTACGSRLKSGISFQQGVTILHFHTMYCASSCLQHAGGGSPATRGGHPASECWSQTKQLPGLIHNQFALLLLHSWTHCADIQSAGMNNIDTVCAVLQLTVTLLGHNQEPQLVACPSLCLECMWACCYSLFIAYEYHYNSH